jgi:hypothetical protein
MTHVDYIDCSKTHNNNNKEYNDENKENEQTRIHCCVEHDGIKPSLSHPCRCHYVRNSNWRHIRDVPKGDITEART